MTQHSSLPANEEFCEMENNFKQVKKTTTDIPHVSNTNTLLFQQNLS